MKKLILFLFSIPAFANFNNNNQICVLLDASAKTLTVTNEGSVGGTVARGPYAPGASERVRYCVSPGVFVPPSPIGTKITASVVAGTRTVTPTSMASIRVSSKINIDTGGSAEVITVTAVTSTTFTAIFANSHTGPFLVDGNTYTACAAPCTSGVSVNMQIGEPYEWWEYVDSDGLPFNPRKTSANRSSFNRALNGLAPCGGLGRLPLIEPAAITTSPLPMPREIIAQDCYLERHVLPLDSGHIFNGVRLFFRIHSIGYKVLTKNDGKVSIQINGGTWITLTQTTSGLTAADELKYGVKPNGVNNDSSLQTGFVLIGGYAQVRDYILEIPDGTILSGDTTATIAWRFNGTDGVTSGFRILEEALIGDSKTMTGITTTSSVAVATSAGHGISASDDVMVWLAPMERRIFNGQHNLSAVTTDTLTFPACDPAPGSGGLYTTGGSKISTCTVADGTYAPWVNRSPMVSLAVDQALTQPYMYVSRMLHTAAAFTYTDPSAWTAPAGGDATRGRNLVVWGNVLGTTGVLGELVAPNNEWVNNTFQNAQCDSCHSKYVSGKAAGAVDLKYYNYSNWVIIMRAMFHGLTYQDGLDIAAYIRGATMPVPVQARPWNPPMQTGPGMSNGTYRRTNLDGSSGPLTNIIVSSNVATVTTSPDHGYATGMWITVPISTVDTDLGGWVYTITVTGAKTFTFPTVNVANGTYTDAALIVTNAHDIWAGCGYDCITTYAYKDMLPSLGDPAKWVWNSRIESVDVAYPYPFPDWNCCWLPQIHPSDSQPGADYLNSSPATLHAGYLANLIPGDFSTLKTQGYIGGADGSNPDATHPSMLSITQRYVGTQFENAAQNLPTKTDLFLKLQYYNAAGNQTPSQHNLQRLSTFEIVEMMTWTTSVAYKMTGFSIPQGIDLHGPATVFGCYPVWSIPDWYTIFNIGAHKVEMMGRNIIDGLFSSYIQAANIWYVMTTAIATNGCFDAPNHPVDNGYYLSFLYAGGAGVAQQRVQGYASTLITQILVAQAGSQLGGLYKGPGGNNQNHMDWTAAYANFWEQSAGPMTKGIWAFTVQEITDYINYTLDNWAALDASQDASYWMTTISNYDGAVCTGAAGAWANTGTFCDNQALLITYFKMFLTSVSDTAGLTKLNTHVAFLKTLTNLVHDWDADLVAALDADIGNVATGDLSVAGNVTVTNTVCPMSGVAVANTWAVIQGSGPGDLAEWRFPTGGTCNAKGATNKTLTFTTRRAHTGTITVTSGCRSDAFPNNQPGGLSFPDNNPTWRCSNMLP